MSNKMSIPKKRLMEIVKEEVGKFYEQNNPWAICSDSVSKENKEKHESCVKDVKKQNK